MVILIPHRMCSIRPTSEGVGHPRVGGGLNRMEDALGPPEVPQFESDPTRRDDSGRRRMQSPDPGFRFYDRDGRHFWGNGPAESQRPWSHCGWCMGWSLPVRGGELQRSSNRQSISA